MGKEIALKIIVPFTARRKMGCPVSYWLPVCPISSLFTYLNGPLGRATHGRPTLHPWQRWFVLGARIRFGLSRSGTV